MHRQSPDDVSRLCEQSGLTPQQYRSFRRRPIPQENSASASGADSSFPRPALVVDRRAAQPVEETRRVLRTPVLEALLGRTHAHQIPTSAKDLRLPAGSMSVVGAAGGAGASTVIATLGRLTTVGGQDVALADTGEASILPLYFGAPRPISGACTLDAAGAYGSGMVHILPRAPRSARLDEGVARTFWTDARPYFEHCSRVILDLSGAASDEPSPLEAGDTTALVVLKPEIRCLARIGGLVGRLESHRGAGPFFLLNDFERSFGLHREIRKLLERELGDALLPFELRRSEDASMALAQRSTVIDYSPNCGLSDDYRRLHDWLSAAKNSRAAGATGE